MGFKEIRIKRSYISKGNNAIVDSFLTPLLKKAVLYKRSVGFFSSSVFELITDGIVGLVRNKGKIQLIASPRLTEEDVKAIELGYEAKKELIYKRFSEDFINEIEKLNDQKLKILSELIARDVLDIRIAVTEGTGIYHDKLGILYDNEGEKVVFYGSSNSSFSGYKNNYEKIRVVKSWEDFTSKETVIEEEEEFDSLWDGTNEFVEIYDYLESAKKNIIEVDSKRNHNKNHKEKIKLRDYQEQAIYEWVKNNYQDFYVMATGTGKTWTAIYSAKKLAEKKDVMIVICAPYKHLVKQWAEDVESAFPKADLILVSSENPNWEQQISDAIIKKKINKSKQVIVISTITSFGMDRFKSCIDKSDEEKLLIVDEAHRFTNRNDDLKKTYPYMLGLSATPFSGNSAAKGKELMEFFGGQVFSLTIEEALDRGFLVPYYYKPIFVYATDEEEEKFNYQSKLIASCFKNGVCINQDKLVRTIRNRLRIISMADEKRIKLDQIISEVKERDHVVIYCGDGRLFDDDEGEEIRHIKAVKKKLFAHDYKASQFTAKEKMPLRMKLVNDFNIGNISALAAIRCLDEGINIPSIKSALILSSNDDYREFVQRRGRILRTYQDKKYAVIYDVLVLPNKEVKLWMKIELRRFLEYARLALNWDELKEKLDDLMANYNIDFDEINVYDYDEMESDIDE